MHPLVSLGLFVDGPALDALPAIESVQAQSLENWELLVVLGGDRPGHRQDPGPIARLARHDARIKFATIEETETAAGWNLALDGARGHFISLLDAADRLVPHGLERLLTAVASGGQGSTGAVFGGYAFRAAIGELPMDPLRGIADEAGRRDEIGLEEWLAGKVLIPSCQLVHRNLIGDLRFQPVLGTAAAYDFFLRLAARGLRWSRAQAPDAGKVVTRKLAPLMDHAATLDSLWTHIRVVEHATRGRAEPAAVREELVRAYLLLVAFERIARLEPDRLLAVPVSIGPTFTRWWQRHGFHGPAPKHLLDQITSPDLVMPQHAELIAERLVESCEPGQPVVLLGLGKNARLVARLLHELGVTVAGRDDGLSAPPAWAAEDGIDLELIPGTRPLDPRAHYLMTVLDDDRFLTRLPGGLKVTRWRDMPGLIEQEWRRILGGRLAESPQAWSPPAPTRGLFKLRSSPTDRTNAPAPARAVPAGPSPVQTLLTEITATAAATPAHVAA